MTISLTAGLFLAFLTSVCVTPVVRMLAPQLGLIDLPGFRKVHVIPTPAAVALQSFWDLQSRVWQLSVDFFRCLQAVFLPQARISGDNCWRLPVVGLSCF